MDAILQIKNVLTSVYTKEKNNYLNAKNEQNADRLLMTVDIMFQCIRVDCKTAELRQQIASVQRCLDEIHKQIRTLYLFKLESESPELYQYYKDLQASSKLTIPSVSKIETVNGGVNLTWDKVKDHDGDGSIECV